MNRHEDCGDQWQGYDVKGVEADERVLTDLEAAQQLQAAAQQYLQEAQSFYASGEGYQDIFALVNSLIEQVLILEMTDWLPFLTRYLAPLLGAS